MTGDGIPPAPLWALVRLPDTDEPVHSAEVVVMFPTPADADHYATRDGIDGYSVAPVTFAVPLFSSHS